MMPVILSGKGKAGEISFHEFEEKFLAICRSHKENNRALAFAFILYDFEHAEIVKVLQDPAYWAALDRISGNYLTVFSFHAGKTQANRERNEFSGPRRFIHDAFGVDLPEARPAVLFFQVLPDSVSDWYLVTIQAETVDQAFVEIRDVFRSAVASVADVQPEFRQNSTEVFNLIRTALRKRKGKLFVKKVSAMIGPGDIVKRIAGLG